MCPEQDVIAIAAGIVTYVYEGDWATDGGTVVISHPTGAPRTVNGVELVKTMEFAYWHLSKITVARGDQVVRGTPLGVAWTPSKPPRSWRPHVNLELRDRGPMKLEGCLTQADEHAFVFPVDC